MSFPKITTKQYLKCRSNRLGSQFTKRLATQGTMIDRNKTKRSKNVTTVKAPSALAKFFTPL